MTIARPRWPDYLELDDSNPTSPKVGCFREGTPTEIIEEYRRDIVGSGIMHVCPECRYELSLSVGMGYHSNPDRLQTKKEIENGTYGIRAKTVFKNNPESSAQWYEALFHCKCGNYQSKSAVLIRLNGNTIYKPSERCRLCMKKMWEVKELPRYLSCPKCSTLMEETGYCNWD